MPRVSRQDNPLKFYPEDQSSLVSSLCNMLYPNGNREQPYNKLQGDTNSDLRIHNYHLINKGNEFSAFPGADIISFYKYLVHKKWMILRMISVILSLHDIPIYHNRYTVYCNVDAIQTSIHRT